jgi:hypothetical protein
MSHLNVIPKTNDSNKPLKINFNQTYIECFNKFNPPHFLRIRLTTKKAIDISKLNNVKDVQMLIPEIKDEDIRRIFVYIPFGGKNTGKTHVLIFDENKNYPFSGTLY